MEGHTGSGGQAQWRCRLSRYNYASSYLARCFLTCEVLATTAQECFLGASPGQVCILLTVQCTVLAACTCPCQL